MVSVLAALLLSQAAPATPPASNHVTTVTNHVERTWVPLITVMDPTGTRPLAEISTDGRLGKFCYLTAQKDPTIPQVECMIIRQGAPVLDALAEYARQAQKPPPPPQTVAPGQIVQQPVPPTKDGGAK